MSKKITLLLSLLVHSFLYSQYCDNAVPSLTVDLTSTPNQQYISPSLFRDGTCCTTSNNCVEFVVTLNPDAVGVVLDVYSGAVPTGALFYQIDCGTETSIGEALCLNDSGPHYITFCKPGGNDNQFIITSLSSPTVSDEITLNEGCAGQLEAYDYEESSITWNSIYPGALGSYNNYLSCSSGCSSISVNSVGNFPSYVDYQVCGNPTGGCQNISICDTVRVFFNSTLEANISASPEIICYGQNGTTLTVNPSGGAGNYSYLWSTGQTAQSIYVTNGGNYTVTVSDASNCPGVIATTNIVKITDQPTLSAGNNINFCLDNGSVQLNASYSNLDGVVWSNGSGNYSNINSISTIYTPSQTEIDNGSVTLNLEGYYTNGCPSLTDQVVVNLIQFDANVDVQVTNVSCFGVQDGSLGVSISGANSPYVYEWNPIGVQNQQNVSNLSPGTYSIEIQNNVGCVFTEQYSITEPDQLTLSLVDKQDVNCFGESNGSFEILASGGVPSYQYSFNGSNSSSSFINLPASNYSTSVEDDNGCVSNLSVDVAEPNILDMQLTTHNVSCYNGSDGRVEVQVSGGVGGYTCQNMTYDATGYGVQNNLAEGTHAFHVTDNNGCQISKNTLITQPDLLELSIVSTDTICPNELLLATANVNGGTMPYTYSWSNSTLNSSSISFQAIQSDKIDLTITDANGCEVFDQNGYHVPILDPNDLVLDIDEYVCRGEEVFGSASYLGNNFPISVSWNNGFVGLGSFQETPENTKDYLLTITDKCNNSVSVSETVLVRELPIIQLPNFLAEGCPPLEVDFSNFDQGVDIETYSWSFGNGALSTDDTPSLTFNESGNINIGLDVIDVYGCENSFDGESSINVYPKPNSSPDASSVVVDEFNPFVQFYNYSLGYDSFTWDFGDGTVLSSEENPQHTFQNVGQYEVGLFVENSYGCLDKKFINIEVQPVASVFIPNAFTPNGDGKNDVFRIEGANLVEENFSMVIYDRWCKVIFETDQLHKGWDGNFNQEWVPNGTYAYKVKVKDVLGKEQDYLGSVAVLK